MLHKFYAIINFLKNSLRFGELQGLNKADVLFICGDDDRGYIYEGQKYAQLIDSINEEVLKNNIETISIQTPYSKFNRIGMFGNVHTVNGIFARISLVNNLLYLLTLGYFNKTYFRIKCWEKIIKKIKPKVILSVQPWKELCIASEMQNTLIADVQHGVFSNERNYGDYYSLEYRKNEKQKGWPNYILCWDQRSKDWIDKNCHNVVQGWVIGHPFVNRFINKNHEDDLVKKAYKKFRIEKTKKKIVLITALCDKERGEGFNSLGFPESAYDLIKGCNQNIEYWMRMHPVSLNRLTEEEINNIFKETFREKAKFKWKMPSLGPLPVVLSMVDLHITEYSSVTIEAAIYKIKTGLLLSNQDILKSWFSYEISSGYAKCINNNPEDIRNWIRSNLSNNKQEKNDDKYINSEDFSLFMFELNNFINNYDRNTHNNKVYKRYNKNIKLI